jgi:TetR/AcrR family transcriptional regulator
MEKTPDIGMEQAILDAAERLFLGKGFALTSTTEIAKAVGCNQALIHYYYRTKENLFQEVFKKKAMVFFSGFSIIDESASSFEENLRRKIEAHFDMVRANPQLPFLIINELTTNPLRIESLKEGLGAIAASVFFPLEARLRAEIAARRIRPISVFDLVINIVSMNVMFFLGSPIVRAIRGMSDEDFEREVVARRHECVEAILRSLRP